MADGIALFRPRLAEPKDRLPLRNDREESHTTAQAMDVTGDVARLYGPHPFRKIKQVRLPRNFEAEASYCHGLTGVH